MIWQDDKTDVLIGTPEWTQMLRPSLTCVQRPEQEMGRTAATALLEQLGETPGPMREHVLNCVLQPGQSVREYDGEGISV